VRETSNTWTIIWNMLRRHVYSQKTISYEACVRENDLCLTIRPSVGTKCNYIRLKKTKNKGSIHIKRHFVLSICSSYFVRFLQSILSTPSKLTLFCTFPFFLIPLHLRLLSLRVHKLLLLFIVVISSIFTLFLFIFISLPYSYSSYPPILFSPPLPSSSLF
jgi:hypothetical protein